MALFYKYISIEIAKYIITIANNKKIFIDITKLNKLLYIIYGIYLIPANERLIDEHPEAWPFGLVFSFVRKTFCKQNLTNLIFNDINLKIINDQFVNLLIDFVLDHFGKWTGEQLITWLCQKNTPYNDLINSKNFEYGNTFKDENIKKYFNTVVFIKYK